MDFPKSVFSARPLQKCYWILWMLVHVKNVGQATLEVGSCFPSVFTVGSCAGLNWIYNIKSNPPEWDPNPGFWKMLLDRILRGKGVSTFLFGFPLKMFCKYFKNYSEEARFKNTHVSEIVSFSDSWNPMNFRSGEVWACPVFGDTTGKESQKPFFELDTYQKPH